ncbi:hypothetical protein B296_00039946 [Ensete ventricosum]|uniref:Uncharacterized protein n=1 Tax=Ensete ventricosum TaxID=4639 RepID=A0A426YWC8_ENSVE|nr:hypothetical protein B296_00039946 [Ensete ventricosum]
MVLVLKNRGALYACIYPHTEGDADHTDVSESCGDAGAPQLLIKVRLAARHFRTSDTPPPPVALTELRRRCFTYCESTKVKSELKQFHRT